MSAYERLRTLAENAQFLDHVSKTYTRADLYTALEGIAGAMRRSYGVNVERRGAVVQLILTDSRSKQPACIVISPTGGAVSPSALYVHRSVRFVLQCFEGNADDTGLEGYSEDPTNWFQAQDRLLLV